MHWQKFGDAVHEWEAKRQHQNALMLHRIQQPVFMVNHSVSVSVVTADCA
jgi:hypothetical protein